jgi:NO-binding membrane sensor protein with MHYT domain
MIKYLLDRAREPSSYAGIAALLSAAGISYNADLFNAGVAAAVALAGFLAVLVPEGAGGNR